MVMSDILVLRGERIGLSDTLCSYVTMTISKRRRV